MGSSWMLTWVVLCGLSACVLQGESDLGDDKPKLLYILLDGFRWDYLEMWREDAFPAFASFIKKGVRAQWTNPVFPSLSFPSWTTLSTGLYPEQHNIIGNYFYDREEKDLFMLSNSTTTVKSKWWTSEPVWITAEKAGLKTAQIKWSRCEIAYNNVMSHHCETYLDEEYHSDNFLRSILKALKKFDEGYDFVQVYTVEPDVMGHNYGPLSPHVFQTLRDLDSVLSVLLDELDVRNMTDKVNIIIVSDHGMQLVSEEEAGFKHIEIDEHLDTSLVEVIADRGAVMHIYAPDANAQQVFNQVKNIPGLSAYKKMDIPEEYHFKNAKYIPQVLLVANDGHVILPSASDKQVPPRGDNPAKATHGFPPSQHKMRGIFFAKGPAFQQDVVIEPIDLVDVYQVVTTVLDIIPLPHNGTWSHVEMAFEEASNSDEEEDNGDEEAAKNDASPSTVKLFLWLTLAVLNRCF